MEEEWRPVPSALGMKASSLGRVWFDPHQKAMPRGGQRWYKTSPTYGYEEKNATGRAGVGKRRIIRIGALKKTFKVAQLVCEAFHGPKPFPKAVTIHIDEDPSNNAPSNLRWGTQKENLNMPKIKEWRKSIRGDANKNTKYPDALIAEIRDRVAKGETQASVSRLFGIGTGAICEIVSGKRRSMEWR